LSILEKTVTQLPSKSLEYLVDALSRLPGVGRKTALRYALYLLKQTEEENKRTGQLISQLNKIIRYCQKCHSICEAELCYVCSDLKRDQSIICVVEDIRDLLAIENTGQYRGLYHVLGGIISPVEGIGPSQLNVDSLMERIKNENTREIIMALSATMEGDTTTYYISKKLATTECSMSVISRGVSIGGDIEYADEVTLGRSIINRIPYDKKVTI